jgi:hypothetical protein
MSKRTRESVDKISQDGHYYNHVIYDFTSLHQIIIIMRFSGANTLKCNRMNCCRIWNGVRGVYINFPLSIVMSKIM